MRFVYAHFPSNITVSEDGKSLRISNFLGEKRDRHLNLWEGVTATRYVPPFERRAPSLG